jgi:hypothetical protein
MARKGNFTIGIDLGMTYDHSALAVVERFQRFRTTPLGGAVREDVHHVSYLHRWELGTHYRQVVSETGLLMQKADLKDAVIVLDGTGVGKEVAMLFLQAHREGRLGHNWPRAYVITGGRETTAEVVPKRELIGKLQTLLQAERLKIADELPLGPVLHKEFLALRVKTTPTGHDSYESARERDHDDIVLSVALGCWFRHTLTQPRQMEGEEEEAHAAT